MKGTVSGIYSKKLLLEPSVIETLNKNRSAREPFADSGDKTFIDFIANPCGMNPQAEQKNDNFSEKVIANTAAVDETVDDINNETFCRTQVTSVNPLTSDENLGEKK